MPVTINLIQDVATPHNNVLIREFAAQDHVKLNLWYAMEAAPGRYPNATTLAHEHLQARIYGTRLNGSFLWYCLRHSQERFLIVGWANNNTRLLHLLLFMLRRPYNHWTDLPSNDASPATIIHRLARWLAYTILRCSRSVIFAVGKPTLDYFHRRGFSSQRVVNLPIFVQSEEDLEGYRRHRADTFSSYGIGHTDFVLSAGSRLIREKGYDLLITAISQLEESVRLRTKALIVGSGDCVQELRQQIAHLSLERHVVLINWLPIETFKTLIACSDVFIHPARMDSYGGTTLGMALGVPVIGSTGAGAAIDRIEHGRNGLLYEAEDTHQLARHIEYMFHNPGKRKEMAQAALTTAKAWPPQRGVQIIVENAI